MVHPVGGPTPFPEGRIPIEADRLRTTTAAFVKAIREHMQQPNLADHPDNMDRLATLLIQLGTLTREDHHA